MFQLPNTTTVNKFIPKNSFDQFINSKQKNRISEIVKRIVWDHRLSVDTINLEGNEIEEIQIFSIELKSKNKINDILKIIDMAIPYHIIFCIQYDNECYISTSSKHSHVKNENQAVIDYTFDTDWFLKKENSFKITLKNSLDWVYKSFCEELSDTEQEVKSIHDLVNTQKENDALQREIDKLQAEIKRCKQFNKKVDLNLKLKELQKNR